MIRRFLLASACVLAGSVAFAPKTMAQSAPVPFQGQVQNFCSVEGVEPGQLNLSGTNVLYGQGAATFACNTSGTVSYNVQPGQPVSGGTAQAQGPNVLSSGVNRIPVILTVTSGAPIPQGNYSYTVVVTAVPGTPN